VKICLALIAAALVGLTGLGANPPALGHDQLRQVAAGTRVSEVAGSRSVRGPASLDSAMRTLLCLEARDARSTGHFSREVLDWVLTNAHNCEDQQLLSDLFGF